MSCYHVCPALRPVTVHVAWCVLSSWAVGTGMCAVLASGVSAVSAVEAVTGCVLALVQSDTCSMWGVLSCVLDATHGCRAALALGADQMF